ncbi:MAG: diaminopimelate decarboxylase, partial [Candidatus Margulisbacteria bacterium]|nr:diaminopimelate decarboxylase [Candidatus Margulisiibacteriota bacterium]
LGGGIGIQYVEEDDPPKIEEVMTRVVKRLNTAVKSYGLAPPKLIIEPGRSLVGQAGLTLYTVGTIKKEPGSPSHIFVDGGMSDNPRPVMYQSSYTFKIATKALEAEGSTYHIEGKFCESGDFLGKSIPLPLVNEGDVLVVFGTGAYNYSMSSNYNRYCKPAMIMVKKGGSHILVERETYTDILRNDRW